MNKHFCKIRLKHIIVPLLLCLCITSQAQTMAKDTSPTDTMTFSLDQALAYAIEFGYQSKNANVDVEIAKKKVNEVIGSGLPQISGAGSLVKNLSIQENVITMADPNGKVTTLKTKFGTDYTGQIGGRIDQLLFDGTFFVGLKASKVYIKLSENNKEKTEIELKKAVSEAYFLAAVAQNNIKDFKNNLETNKQTLKETTALFKSGFAEDIDVDQIKLLVNESKQLYLNAKRQLNIGMAVLKFSMGFDIDKNLKISDNTDDLLAPVQNNPQDKCDYNSHIDIKTIETQIDLQKLAIQKQRSYAFPRLTAFYNYNRFFMGDKISDMSRSDGSSIGINLAIPIFSGGSRSSKLKQEKLKLEQLDNSRMQVAQNLKRNYMVTKSNLMNSHMQYDNTKEARDIAQRIYDKSIIKYKNGVISSLELSQIESKLIQSHINYRQSSASYYNDYITYKEAINQL